MSPAWEHGSDFHLLPVDGEPTGARDPRWQLHGSGRGALLHLLTYLRRAGGVRRVLVPYYYCHEVTDAVRQHGFEVVLYDSGPLGPHAVPGTGAGDVVIVVNYFGLMTESPVDVRNGSCVVEDHTHDPYSAWAGTSTADWCFASLRKTLPLPDGGCLWSPRGEELPLAPGPDPRHVIHALDRMRAMAAKARYLTGEAEDKEAFRQVYMRSEAGFTAGVPSGISSWSAAWLGYLPVARWRAARRANHALLADMLQDVAGLQLLAPGSPDATPAVATLLTSDAAQRRSVRARLIARAVYPAVLWPAPPSEEGMLPQHHRDVVSRVLSVHCDMRYGAADMERVAAALKDAVK